MNERANGLHSRDAGFTLVELIVVTVLMGLVTAAVSFAAMTLLKTAPLAGARADTTAAERSLALWLSRDLAGVPNQSFSTADGGGVTIASADRCPGAAGAGIPIIELGWTIDTSSTMTEFHVADYRLVEDGSGRREISRITCSSPTGFDSGLTSTAEVDLQGRYDATQTGPLATFAPGGLVTIALKLAPNSSVSPPPPPSPPMVIELAPRSPQ